MPPSPRFHWLLAFPLAAVPGCGLAEYEALMDRSLGEYQELSRFQRLYGPTVLKTADDAAEYPITIRLPQRLFGPGDSFSPESDYRNSGEAPPPERLYPPFLGDFPGLLRMGEGFAKTEGNQRVSFYYYVGVLESRAADLGKLLADLRKKMLAAKLQVGEWQDVDVFDEKLQPVAWKMIEATGNQRFDNPAANQENFKPIPGAFHLYVREDQGYIVLWGVRLPDMLAGENPLLDLAKGVAGSVKVTAPAPTGPLPKATPAAKQGKAPSGEAPME